MIRLLVATRNDHKVEEIRAILGDGFECLTLNGLPGAPEVVEDAATFAGNATKKAVELARWMASNFPKTNSPGSDEDLFVLADDSGLEVDALDGSPGVHSARFSALDTGKAGNSSAADNNQKLLRLLRDVPREKRSARFRCVLVLTPVFRAEPPSASPVCYADEFETRTEIFDGACEGRIGLELRGKGGFGYDPLFFPNGFDQTFGELGAEVKNRLSHRGQALERMRQWFQRSTSAGGATNG
jgi:XTP/dITP diphosphohydrolase